MIATARSLGRVVAMMLRPPVLAVVVLFAAIGIAQAEPQTDLHPLLTVVLAIVAPWFVNAAVLNDLADERIDRVNLEAARGRPLVSGATTRRQLLALGLAAGAISLAVAATQGWQVTAVVAAGLVFNAAYSLPPVQLSTRGGLASVVLPSAFVVVPYLVGALTVDPDLGVRDLALLPGLYVGFVGRILLKDFRDVAGDALFGKWTFLLRHGRAATCQASAVCWVVGATTAVLALEDYWPATVAVAVFVACALHGLRRLAGGSDPVADQVVIGAIAMAGRGLCTTILAHLTMLGEDWAPGPQAIVLALLAVTFAANYATTLTQRAPAWALHPC